MSKILIVEDEDSIRRVLKKVLSNKLDNYLKRYPSEREKITKTFHLDKP